LRSCLCHHTLAVAQVLVDCRELANSPKKALVEQFYSSIAQPVELVGDLCFVNDDRFLRADHRLQQGHYPVSFTTRMPCRRVIRALGQRATAVR